MHVPITRGILRRTVDHVRAVDGVSATVQQGQTVGLVGESGSGKTTLGLALLRLVKSDGPVVFLGEDLQGKKSAALRPLRKRTAMTGCSIQRRCQRPAVKPKPT